MKKIRILLAYALLSVSVAKAQHTHHSHAHNHNEIGVSTGALYAIDDKEWGTGIHVHYFRTLGTHSRWALGGFIEQAWLDDYHLSVGAGAKYQLTEKLNVGAFPGISFARHIHAHGHEEETDGKAKTKASFSMHLEVVYDLFEWKNIHLGPVMDYSWAKDDAHVSVGVHVAYGF